MLYFKNDGHKDNSEIIIVALIFGLFANSWNSEWFSSSYLIIYPFFRTLGTVAVFSLCMHISWTKSAATMFTSYMALSNISTTVGSKLAGSIEQLGSFDTSFIIIGILSVIPLLLIFFVDSNQIKSRES